MESAAKKQKETSLASAKTEEKKREGPHAADAGDERG